MDRYVQKAGWFLMDTDISKWADSAMFSSEMHDAQAGPRVYLLSMTTDPLGSIAACAKMYKGEVVRSRKNISGDEREHYLGEMKKTKLKMPLEAVQFHFLLDGVTRAFTHQLVRQRTAAYAQESMRFAVVEDMTCAVALPPSLARFNNVGNSTAAIDADDEGLNLAEDEGQYIQWLEAVSTTSRVYNNLVNSGMPAEDARGLLPTNVVTRIHYITNLRALLDHAGNRLCTQAQFEWRLVFAQIAKAIREYSQYRDDADLMDKVGEHDSANALELLSEAESWQYKAISELLLPVCYQTGKCVFEAEFDRKCKIRERVQGNASIGRASFEWGTNYDPENAYSDGGPREGQVGGPWWIRAIDPAEWLTDPGAAR
jgi:flavin-dependent thymidylate synthase